LHEQRPVEPATSVEVGERKVFVGSVHPTIGKGEAEEKGIRAEDALKSIDDRDASSFTDDSEIIVWKDFPESPLGGLAVGRMGIGGIRFARMTPEQFEGDAWWAKGAEMSGNLFENDAGSLPRNEAESELCHCLTGKNRFCPNALKSTGEAIDFGRGPPPKAFRGGEPRLASNLGRTRGGEDLGIAKRQAGPSLTFPRL
jgi:hypothetical protein